MSVPTKLCRRTKKANKICIYEKKSVTLQADSKNYVGKNGALNEGAERLTGKYKILNNLEILKNPRKYRNYRKKL